jgi:hypothetical protein
MPFEDDLGWEYFGVDPMSSPRMMEHMDWHNDPDNQSRTGNYGERFLVFHKQFVDKFDDFRHSRGLLSVTPWDPATPIPADLAHTRVLSDPRSTDNPVSINPACRTPAWATIAGGNEPDPLLGYTSLLQFQSLDELGRSIDAGWHGTVHNTIGGDMAAFHSPIDPIFWRWHRWIDGIRAAWAANQHVQAELRLSQTVRLLFGDAARTGGGVPAVTLATPGHVVHPQLRKSLIEHLISDATELLGHTKIGPVNAGSTFLTPLMASAPQGAAMIRPLDAPSLADTHVVYVHGICKHVAGFSDPWWAALKQFAPDLLDANRHEVVWSDIVEPDVAVTEIARVQRRAQEALALALPARVSGDAALAAQIKDILADRAARQFVQAATGTTTQVGSVASIQPSMEAIAPQALFNIPGVECIDDFSSYLLNDEIRSQVIDRFNGVVQPLLRPGRRVHVISHSWGTVITYEALRGMDGDSSFTDAAITTLFTVGSALAIAPVKRMLLPSAIDGRRPRVVQNWVNLNARFDIVGGQLRGNPFQVDSEFLELSPVGCNPIIPNPVCAHGSYFNAGNVPVNRDIFAQVILG